MTPEEIAAELTSILRTPAGTMSLRPVQGRIGMGAVGGGAFSNASVGLGKSLALAVSMAVAGGDRPLILTEANNLEPMRAEFDKYRAHFNFPSCYRLESYHTISNRPELLDELRPTMVGLDEAQCVKRRDKSGRGKRVYRWRVANPDVPMVVLSGSPGEEFAEYAHLMVWGVPSLRADRGGIIPVNEEGYPEGPEFRDLCKRLREDSSAHAAFWERLRSWPGVVISSETYTEKPLVITHEIRATPPEMEEHWSRLRTAGEAPDGWFLEGLGEQWGLARQMAGSGCYYEHIPRPPEEYRAARKAWYKFCQTIIDMGELANGGPYDTEGQVAQACLMGNIPDAIYQEWMRQKPTYNPETRTAWLTTEALDAAEAWGRARAPLATRTSGGSIIWTRWSAFGHELSRRTGWPYYGKEARDARRWLVQDATDPVIICSTKSCGTGKNLQRYSRALFMNPPSNCIDAEQQIGREHRSNQLADLVEVTFSYGCLEDWCAAAKAEASASTAEDDLTAPRKLLLAQHNRTSYVEVDTDDDSRGLAWRKADKTVVVQVPDEED